MVRRDRWEELRRLWSTARVPIAELARRFDLDRKTVRRCVRDTSWEPYRRPARTDTLLAAHAAYVRDRAPAVNYSAQILLQELRPQGYTGSYETVKLFVRPLRAAAHRGDGTLVRFETPPGQQSQIDWGTVTVHLGAARVELHLFVLTLGFSRRAYYDAYLSESLPPFLDAHERAFEHFGGHTREHLYDRPRTVCQGGAGDRIRWTPTFKAFADYWGFEPRVCRPYRAQTKGKVESGVKYVKRNFLPGRTFRDFADFRTQLQDWMTAIADVRIHGTTHERPLERFQQEQAHLVATAGQPPFRLEAQQTRIVAADYLVSFETNRYSVPFGLIGQTVEVRRAQGRLEIFHRGIRVAAHAELLGKHQLRILPEHGPGAIARTARQRRSLPAAGVPPPAFPEVEVRDLAWYEAVAGDREMATPLAGGDCSASWRAALVGTGSETAPRALAAAEVTP
ncbi:MAG TPA: IS21 family transposase [Spirochaetia bacterium]|nr:IS21 family transposase [Spirochaetia bacterium]